jgi:hypothetical protein
VSPIKRSKLFTWVIHKKVGPVQTLVIESINYRVIGLLRYLVIKSSFAAIPDFIFKSVFKIIDGDLIE